MSPGPQARIARVGVRAGPSTGHLLPTRHAGCYNSTLIVTETPMERRRIPPVTRPKVELSEIEPRDTLDLAVLAVRE